MDRDKALDMTLGQIEKQFGKGAVMRLGEDTTVLVPAIPTGALSLDIALGVGGLPRGRVVEIYGPESSGKTTVALHAIAEAQKLGGIAAFIDAEHALDPTYAAALGVDVDGLLVSQPDTGEQALEITDMLVRSGAVDIVVIDSVAALTPRAEIEGEMGDTHVGLQARLMSQALRKLAGTLHRSNTCAVFINQLREKIGVMFGCFSAPTLVTLADGSQEEIGRIVRERLAVDVLSYDEKSGDVVVRPVVDWHDNGPTEEFLRFKVSTGDGGPGSTFECTPNHLIQTDAGWKEARLLREDDKVMTASSAGPSALVPGVVQTITELAGDGQHRFDITVAGTHNYFVDGVMVHNSPETTPGGRALKFYSSVRLDVRRIESLKDGTDVVGNRVRVKVVKNKVAPPFRQAEFDIMYGQGISAEGSILDIGVDEGIVKKSGAWYTYDGEQLGQGRENARKFLQEHDEVAAEISKRVTEQLGLASAPLASDEAEPLG